MTLVLLGDGVHPDVVGEVDEPLADEPARARGLPELREGPLLEPIDRRLADLQHLRDVIDRRPVRVGSDEFAGAIVQNEAHVELGIAGKHRPTRTAHWSVSASPVGVPEDPSLANSKRRDVEHWLRAPLATLRPLNMPLRRDDQRERDIPHRGPLTHDGAREEARVRVATEAGRALTVGSVLALLRFSQLVSDPIWRVAEQLAEAQKAVAGTRREFGVAISKLPLADEQFLVSLRVREFVFGQEAGVFGVPSVGRHHGGLAFRQCGFARREILLAVRA